MPATVTVDELAAITRRLDLDRLWSHRALLAREIAAAADAHAFGEVLELLRDVARVEDQIEAFGRTVRDWSKDVVR